jgi:DNA primase
MFDADEAGRDCADDVLKRLVSKIFVRVVQLPSDKTQPDQLMPGEIKEVLGA